MPSLLFCRDQAFWVSNSTKDLLYEAAVAVASPDVARRLAEDGRLVGCYEVSGVGFELKAFAEAFGGVDAWKRMTEERFDAVEALCPHARCVALMRKVLAWAWFLLDGGRCNGVSGKRPTVEDLPDRPG
jgi:hypothetical protein